MSHQQTPKTLIQVFSDDWLPHSSLFTNVHARGFISESGVVFDFVQRVSHGHTLLSHSEMIKASRKYRSVIHSWFIKINEDLLDNGDLVNENLYDNGNIINKDKQELSEISKILHKMEIAWHLCEILYINIPSAGTLLIQLLNWIKFHFTYYVELADKMVVSDLPQMHQNYWDVIMFFVLRGDMEYAILLLELHSESRTDQAFLLVRDLLKKFPLINNAIVIHEYYLRWCFWRESILQAIRDDQIPEQSNKRSYQQLNLLLKLMAGNLDAFKQVKYLFHSWYQMMVSYALFTDPCLKNGTNDLIDKFIEIFYADTNPSTMVSMTQSSITKFDQLIRHSFNYDLIEVIKQSSMCFDDGWWFVTHFVDLIYNSSRYSDYQFTDISMIRDSFVLNYANSLFAKRKQFWQLSIEYLCHCPESQQNILTCLEHVSFQNEHELQRLLTACRRFNFNELEYSLCRIQARKWLTVSDEGNQKKLGSALFWAIRSKDKLLINHIVDEFLRNYLRSANVAVSSSNEKQYEPIRLLDEDMISNIGGSIILSERLIFLCKYHEFHQLCRQGQFGDAAKILVDDMLTSNAIPDFFQFQVIQDCLPLLQNSSSSSQIPPFITQEQTCKILSSLEQLLYRLKKIQTESTTQHNQNNNTNGLVKSNNHNSLQQTNGQQETLSLTSYNQKKLLEQVETKLRMAVAKNLSENFVTCTIGLMD